MKKIIFFIIIFINLILLSSCNTSRPSAYLTTADNKKGVVNESVYVTFETNGGNSIERISIEKGKILNVPKNPTRENAEFNGWFIDKELTIPYDFGSLVNESFTLYASWSVYNKITFNSNGGTKVENQYVKDGYNVSFSSTKRDGYEFNGWFIDDDFKTPFDFSSVIFNDITLYANWIKYHKVIFETVGEIVISNQYIKDGYNVSYFVPPKNNSTFEGWYLDKEFTKKFDFSSVITEDLILYARWI